jgi:hypothetical protein
MRRCCGCVADISRPSPSTRATNRHRLRHPSLVRTIVVRPQSRRVRPSAQRVSAVCSLSDFGLAGWFSLSLGAWTAMICSSVNLIRFIGPSFKRPDSNSPWRKNLVAGQRIRALRCPFRKMSLSNSSATVTILLAERTGLSPPMERQYQQAK